MSKAYIYIIIYILIESYVNDKFRTNKKCQFNYSKDSCKIWCEYVTVTLLLTKIHYITILFIYCFVYVSKHHTASN